MGVDTEKYKNKAQLPWGCGGGQQGRMNSDWGMSKSSQRRQDLS